MEKTLILPLAIEPILQRVFSYSPTMQRFRPIGSRNSALANAVQQLRHVSPPSPSPVPGSLMELRGREKINVLTADSLALLCQHIAGLHAAKCFWHCAIENR
jgi:hypothetical protein